MDRLTSTFLGHFKADLDSIEKELVNCKPSQHCLIPGCQSCSRKHRYVRANEISRELARLSLRGQSPYLVTITSPNWEFVLPSLNDGTQIAQFCDCNSVTLETFETPLSVESIKAITDCASKNFGDVLHKFYCDTLRSVQLLAKYEYTGRVMPEVDFNYTSAGLKIKLHLHCVVGHRGKLSRTHRMKYTPPTNQRDGWLNPEDPRLVKFFCQYLPSSDDEYTQRLSTSSAFDADRIPLLFAITESVKHQSVHTAPVQNRKEDFERVGLYLTKTISANEKIIIDGLPGEQHQKDCMGYDSSDLPPTTAREIRQLIQLIDGKGLLNSIALQKRPHCQEEVVGDYELDEALNVRRVVARTRYSKRSRTAFMRMRRVLKQQYDGNRWIENDAVPSSEGAASMLIKSVENSMVEQLGHGDVLSGGDAKKTAENAVLTEPIRRALEILANIYGLHQVLEYSLAKGRKDDAEATLRLLERYDLHFPTMLPASSLERRFPLLSPGCSESNFFHSWFVLLTDIDFTSGADRNRFFTYRGGKKGKNKA